MSNKENKTVKTASVPTPPLKPTAPKKPRQKSLTLKGVEKQYKELSKLSTFVIDPETNLVIKYYEKFDEIKIQELLQFAYEHLTYAQENKLDFFSSDGKFLEYIHYLIIMKFSNLGDDQPTDFESHKSIRDQIISTGLFNLFFESIFDGNEVIKIIERFEQFTSLVNQIANLEESSRNEVLSSVRNKEILNYTQPAVIHPLVNPKVVK